MDRSFEGLLISFLLHIVLVVLFFNLPAPPPPKGDEKTEITIVDPTPIHKKSQNIVTETEKKVEDLKDLKDTADFLSQFTKRVKKQIIARENGPTKNSQPTPIPIKPRETSERNRVAGLDSQNDGRREDGIGLPPPGGNQALRQMAIGSSSIAEYVPGVEQGEFTALNTDQFTYYGFYARINDQVRNRWVSGIRSYVGSLSVEQQAALSKMDRQTVVEIILDKDGEYKTHVVHHSSGDRTLDQLTVSAFKSAAPFLNPPKGMIDSEGKIHLHYGFVVRFRPPLG